MRLLVRDNKHLKCLNAGKLVLTNCAEKQAGSGIICPNSLYYSDAVVNTKITLFLFQVVVYDAYMSVRSFCLML